MLVQIKDIEDNDYRKNKVTYKAFLEVEIRDSNRWEVNEREEQGMTQGLSLED